MYTHEKKLFEVATHNTKSYIKLRYVYVFLSVLVISIWIYFQPLMIYMVPAMIVCIIFGVLSEIYIHKRNIRHQDIVKHQFKRIFYPAIISSLTQEDPLVFKIDHIEIEHNIQTSDMYQDLNYETYVNVHSKVDHIAMTIHQFQTKKVNYRIFISTPYDKNIEVEMRSFLRPKQNYVYKEQASGFHMYALKKEHIHMYKKMFEKLRVIKDIDQLDVKIKNGRMYVTYKLTSLKIPHIYQSSDKVILMHETYFKRFIESYQAISKTLKEISHAY
jgi:hypothetical protein